ncbi:MAG: hypothetical protein M1833_004813 [Piccolia ochrophora]|nr:MAG: hypothetical protein M1833_004813 [Piccolia ochrophora]
MDMRAAVTHTEKPMVSASPGSELLTAPSPHSLVKNDFSNLAELQKSRFPHPDQMVPLCLERDVTLRKSRQAVISILRMEINQIAVLAGLLNCTPRGFENERLKR